MNDKVESTSKPAGAQGGASSSGSSGITGSKRSYPKGGAPKMDASGFNPMNAGANDWVTGGVGAKE